MTIAQILKDNGIPETVISQIDRPEGSLMELSPAETLRKIQDITGKTLILPEGVTL